MDEQEIDQFIKFWSEKGADGIEKWQKQAAFSLTDRLSKWHAKHEQIKVRMAKVSRRGRKEGSEEQNETTTEVTQEQAIFAKKLAARAAQIGVLHAEKTLRRLCNEFSMEQIKRWWDSAANWLDFLSKAEKARAKKAGGGDTS
jgi:hypothetical protein